MAYMTCINTALRQVPQVSVEVGSPNRYGPPVLVLSDSNNIVLLLRFPFKSFVAFYMTLLPFTDSSSITELYHNGRRRFNPMAQR